MLFPAFLSLIGPVHATGQQGQRDCANLRVAVLQLVSTYIEDASFPDK